MEVGCARCTTYKIIEINERKQTKHIKTQFDSSVLAKKWSCSVVLNGASQFLVVNFAKTVSGARRRWWLEAIPAISMLWTLPLPSSSAGCFFSRFDNDDKRGFSATWPASVGANRKWNGLKFIWWTLWGQCWLFTDTNPWLDALLGMVCLALWVSCCLPHSSWATPKVIHSESLEVSCVMCVCDFNVFWVKSQRSRRQYTFKN